MRADIKEANRGRTLSFWGANREKRRLEQYLHDGEIVHDMLACSFGDTGGRSLLVITDERILAIKDGWIFKNSQGMSYQDIRSVEFKSGMLFASLEFRGEGMEFEVTKAGRFSGEHAVKLIRGRVGSRYAKWERDRQTAADAAQTAVTSSGNGPVFQNVEANHASSSSTSSVPAVPSFPAFTPMPAGAFETPSVEPVSDPNAIALSPGVMPLDAFVEQPVRHTQPSPPVRPVRPNIQQSTNDLVTELERLDTLKRSGALTADQYEAAKQRLLS
jgi:hypothetical protein